MNKYVRRIIEQLYSGDSQGDKTMDSLQKKYNDLLIELTQYCEENAIMYRLHGQTAKMAYLSAGYVENCIETTIEMTVDEAEKLILCMAKDPIPNRCLEYMGSNKDYPGFSIRYTDPSTLYLNLSQYGNSQRNDMGIEIVILRKHISKKWKKYMLLALEIGWEMNTSYPPSYKLKVRHIVSKLLIKSIQLLVGREKVGKCLFNKLMLNYRSTEDVCVRRLYGKVIHLPRMSEYSYVEFEFEGRLYPVAEDIKKYLQALYGDKWDKLNNVEEPGMNLVVDDRISYSILRDVFLQVDFSIEEYYRNHRNVRKGVSLRGTPFRQKNNIWKSAIDVEYAMQSEKFYQTHSEYIRNLIDNYAYEELNKLLKPYGKILNLKDGYTYNSKLNEELFEIYVHLLNVKGKKKEAERLLAESQKSSFL